jgi:diguanylate cyclase (GGDEF)-like protein/PAS domain S-box-containing protein
VTLRLITDTPGAPAVPLDPAAFEQLFNRAGSVLAILDAQARFIAVNAACERVLGRPPSELIGHSLLEDLHPHDPSSAVRSAAGSGGWQEGFVELLGRHRHADGSWRWLLWSGSSHEGRWYAAAKDVTEWIRLEQRAGRDPLTGLPNREVFLDELEHALERHARSDLSLAVLYVDIDAFATVNQTLGREAADRLLGEAAARIRGTMRAGDIVARLAGDQFVALLELLEDAHEAVAVARRVLAAFERPFEHEGQTVELRVSAGLALAHDASQGADGVIREADIAMHRAKTDGRARFAIFDAAVRAEVDRRLTVERELRGALASASLEVRYQPIVSLEDGSPLILEALLRWTHPRWGVISPAEFVPLAEENGLIVPIGEWVLESALGALARWRAGGRELAVSVNLSPAQLADDQLVATVARLLAQTGVPAPALCLDVTETVVLAEPIRAATRLAELRGLGVRIAFDNFGTGYSSLHHLSRLPVDLIKLDRSFIGTLGRPGARRNRAVLIAVVAAARELGIDVVAEGVEDAEQLAEVRHAGCTLAQGHLFAAACPAAEVTLEPFAVAVGTDEIPAAPPPAA